jgi:hypothetical protein
MKIVKFNVEHINKKTAEPLIHHKSMAAANSVITSILNKVFSSGYEKYIKNQLPEHAIQNAINLIKVTAQQSFYRRDLYAFVLMRSTEPTTPPIDTNVVKFQSQPINEETIIKERYNAQTARLKNVIQKLTTLSNPTTEDIPEWRHYILNSEQDKLMRREVMDKIKAKQEMVLY